MSHTPGPWEVDGAGVYEARIKDTVTLPDGSVHRQGLIALPYERYGDTFTDGANARLIAAAPDLLAALRPFVAMLEGMESATDGTHIPCSVAMRDLVAARAAIAKAEGRTP